MGVGKWGYKGLCELVIIMVWEVAQFLNKSEICEYILVDKNITKISLIGMRDIYDHSIANYVG